MNNKSRMMLQTLLMVIAIVLIIMGVAIEIYLISILGLILILAMLIFRGIHIRKLNEEIKEIKKSVPNEIDDTEV